MDSIKSKMLSLSQATSEATARALIYEEELRKNNDLADRFEEQVITSFMLFFYSYIYIIF